MTNLDEHIGRLFYKCNLNPSSIVIGGMSHLNLVWKINNTEDTFIIPRLLLERLNKSSSIQNIQDSEIVMPLRFNLPTFTYPESVHEFKSLNTFFRNISELMLAAKLVKCNVNGEIYYVGNDLIINSDFVPLITLGYEIKYLDIYEKYSVSSKIVFISPLVYSEYNKMSRFLCSKFIPAFLSSTSLNWPVRVPDREFWHSNSHRASNAKVIVDKFATPFKLVPCDTFEELTFNTDAINADLNYLFQ